MTRSKPERLLREYESSSGKRRAFCSNCGSPLFAYLSATADVMRIRLDSLDSTFSKLAKAHTFVSQKAAWETTDAKLKGDARFRASPHHGFRGWMALELSGRETDWSEINELLESAYRHVAGKELVAELDRESDDA